jgi:hypothetical protein
MDNMQPEITTSATGTILWFLNGELHRTDGPAFEYDNGTKLWYLHGELHRTDGPAGEYADGGIDWYLNGRYLSFEGWLEETTGLTDEEKVMMKLKYG